MKNKITVNFPESSQIKTPLGSDTVDKIFDVFIKKLTGATKEIEQYFRVSNKMLKNLRKEV